MPITGRIPSSLCVVGLLVLAPPATTAQDSGESLVHAAKIGDAAWLKGLLATGAKVDAADVYGETALTEAAYRGNKQIVEILIEAGAEVEAKDKQGRTALSYAVSGNQKEIAQLFEKAAVGR